MYEQLALRIPFKFSREVDFPLVGNIQLVIVETSESNMVLTGVKGDVVVLQEHACCQDLGTGQGSVKASILIVNG